MIHCTIDVEDADLIALSAMLVAIKRRRDPVVSSAIDALTMTVTLASEGGEVERMVDHLRMTNGFRKWSEIMNACGKISSNLVEPINKGAVSTTNIGQLSEASKS